MRHLSLLYFLFLFLVRGSHALSSCVAFDISWNLLAFGFNGKDYNAGTQDKWALGTAQDITNTLGRPPFDTANVTCYLSQYINVVYIIGADKANPSSVYIYDAMIKSWSKQAVRDRGFDPSSFSAILDHDTNIFYAYFNGKLSSLDMSLLKAASPNSLQWNVAVDPGFGNDYKPVMALAQNHIYFLDVPSIPIGSAKIFVIHYSIIQSDPQYYGNFPATHGQASSFFEDSGVQKAFAFIPDDGAYTYVINVETNTTQTFPGPNIKDSSATYFASTDSLVQLTSSGNVEYLPCGSSAGATATWSPVNALPVASPSVNSGATPGGNNSSASNSGGKSKQTTSPPGADSAKANQNGASLLPINWKFVGLYVVGLCISANF